jgi:hypothetical protein
LKKWDHSGKGAEPTPIIMALVLVAVDDNDGSLISGAIFSFQPLGKRDL